MEALKLMTLKLGDPKTSPPFGWTDQRRKHQFEHRSFPEEGRRRLGASAFLLKEWLQQICCSDGAPMGRWAVKVSDTGLKVLLEAADSRGQPFFKSLHQVLPNARAMALDGAW